MKTQLRVKTQLMLLSGVFMVMLLAIGSIGAYKVKVESNKMQSLYADRVVPLKQLKSVADMYAVNIVDTTHKIRDGALSFEEGIEAIDQARKMIRTEWEAYTATDLVPREQELIARIKPMLAAADASVGKLEKILRASDKLALTDYAARDMYPVLDPLQSVISDLIQVQLDVSKAAYQDSLVNAKSTLAIVLGAAFVAAILGGSVATWITRGLTRALGAEPADVKRAADAVAKGILNHDIALRSGDSDSVMAAMKQMSDTLQQTVMSVRENSESVASASAQISQGNTELSSRTEEQASALEETAASMEQIQTTVKQNADSAAMANQLAASANMAATKGGTVVEEVVNTMKKIDDASREIVEIISVIDGIAFQTNILALNAAVEAARAGDQGRGFAVVASEVRHLAQRSATAAKEIKALIAANVARVDAGSAQAAQAGLAMSEIVTAIQRVTDLMGEISAASKEQSLGIAQVTEAVQQMDQVTQQNAALVEESAAAAESLKQQALDLVSAVSVFKLSSAADVSTTSTWSGAERRGPNRATNVTRPNFGKSASTRMPSPEMTTAVTASKRTGTDSWTTF